MEQNLWLGPVIRILLRYGIGILIGYGLLSEATRGLAEDPDAVFLIEMAAYFLLAVFVEVWYGLAKKYGWAR